MASYEYTLCKQPDDERRRELWLQHAAGLIVLEDARNYAIDRIPDDADPETRQKIIAGIDDAIYGMMMIFDGVSGTLQNSEYEVTLNTFVSLVKRGDKESTVLQSLNLSDGDGMCMGYHGWLEGDYGKDPVAGKK